jgi:hypothetical protein
MTRLLTISDAVLAARLHALRLSAVDLQARLQAVAETEQSGRKASPDGSWKRLSRLLRRMQAELNEAEKEQARRRLAVKQRVKSVPLTRDGRMSSVLGPKLTTA